MIPEGVLLTGSNGKKWVVEKYLASGVCCDVYKVKEPFQKDKISLAAVKVFKEGQRYASACKRENELLYLVKRTKGQLNNLVSVLDAFSWLNRSCLVEELLYCDLDHVVNEHQAPLHIDLIKQISKDVLSGLLELHSMGFVHGDLKPSNVMWNTTSNIWKLIDFSLSFHVEDKNIPKLQSKSYRAPEVQKWNEYIDRKTELDKCEAASSLQDTCMPVPVRPSESCDIWSFGCLCLYMFAGEVFFTCERISAVEDLAKSNPKYVNRYIQTEANKVTAMNGKESCHFFKDMLIRCLEYGYDKRSNTQQCLDHAYFLSAKEFKMMS